MFRCLLTLIDALLLHLQQGVLQGSYVFCQMFYMNMERISKFVWSLKEGATSESFVQALYVVVVSSASWVCIQIQASTQGECLY